VSQGSVRWPGFKTLLRLMNLALQGRLKLLLTVLGWATSSAALTLAMIFLGYLLPKNINGGGGLYGSVINASQIPLWIYYVANFSLCVLATVMISDMSRSLLSFFASYFVAAVITVTILSLPDYFGCCGGALQGAAVSWTFVALFPYLFLIELAGTFTGIGLAEHFL